MKIHIRFFAALRERAGATEQTYEVDEPLTVGELWERIRRERPALAEIRGAVAFARNQEYVDRETTLQDNDEIAFIPPVSGGVGARDHV